MQSAKEKKKAGNAKGGMLRREQKAENRPNRNQTETETEDDDVPRQHRENSTEKENK